MNELKRELRQLAEKLQRKRKLQAMQASLGQEEKALLQKEQQLQGQLTREEADVARLESTSAASIFYAALGKKEARLEKERQEACAAQLKYAAVLRQRQDCLRRIRALAQEEQELAGCQASYDKLFGQVYNSMKTDPAYARQLAQLEQQQGATDAQLHELGQAVAAGQACLAQIAQIEQSLNSAEDWGTWDVFGGGMITGMAKHSSLNKAQADAEQLQSLLSRFKTELADVEITAQLGQVRVEGFLLFADYFFDGLIADWCVLSRIEESQCKLGQVKEQVVEVLEKLEQLRATLERRQTALAQQHTELVQGS